MWWNWYAGFLVLAVIGTQLTNGQVVNTAGVRMDLALIIDGSSSICENDPSSISVGGHVMCDNWDAVRQFLAFLIESLDVGPNNVRVALVMFGEQGTLLWDFTTYLDSDDLYDAIVNITYPNEPSTNTSGGLRVAYDEAFSPSGGDRLSVANVAIVLTDGASTVDTDRTIPDAERLRDEKDVEIFAVGVTANVVEDELRNISSPPQLEGDNYFMATNFSQLLGLRDQLLNRTEESLPPAENCENWVDLLFFLDSSPSVTSGPQPVGYTNWELMTGFVMDVIDRWGVVGDQGARVAIIVFGGASVVEISLDEFDDIESLRTRLQSLQPFSGTSPDSDPFRLAREQVFTGLGGDRPAVSNVAVMLSDGNATSNIQATFAEAEALRDVGVQIYGIGIGGGGAIDEAVLKGISSPPQEINENYWLSLDFQSLAVLVYSLDYNINEYLCGFVEPPPLPDRDCEMDVALIVDSSGSIRDANPIDGSYDNWQVVKDFAAEFAENIEGLTVEGGETRVAVVRITRQSDQVDFHLNQYLGKPTEIVAAIRNLSYAGSWTNTPEALKTTREQVFLEVNGDRPGSPNVVLIITDGKPEIDNTGFLIEETVAEAEALRKQGVQIFAIGVTTDAAENPISDETLRRVASLPQKLNENYWKAPDFRSLFPILVDLSNKACDPPPQECQADIIFVLDYSGSIGHTKFRAIRDFASSFILDMDVGAGTRVGAVVFSTTEKREFHLDEYDDRDDASDAVRAIHYFGGRTNTGAAIEEMRTNMFTEANGDRENITNIAIVLTDGGSNTPDKIRVMSEVFQAKRAGIHFIVVGVGKWVDQYELNAIASAPYGINMISAPDVGQLITKKGEVQQLVCNLIDECADSPCENGGTCIDGIGLYWCQCPQGFVGINCTTECREDADVALLLDASGSVGEQNFQRELDFVSSLIYDGLNLGNNHQLALMTFSDSSAVHFHLDEFDNNVDALDGLAMYYDKGTTDTADALQDMRRSVLVEAQGGRLGVSKVGVLVTDGRSDDADGTWDEARQSRLSDIEMLVVGVGNNMRRLELEGIASSPISANVMRIGDFLSFGDVIDDVTDAVCNNVDECGSDPCQNSGTCVDLRNGFNCLCPIDFTGVRCERGCTGEVDLVFAIDASGSMRSRRFLKVLDFVANILEQLEISPDKTRVGMVLFSQDSRTEFYLNTYTSKQDVIHHVRLMKYIGLKTHTSSALRRVMSDMLTNTNGDRDDVDDIVIVITNANSNVNPDRTLPDATDLRNTGAYVIAVGVGDIDIMELRGLATHPQEDFLFVARSQDDLPDLEDSIVTAICDDVDECSIANPCQNGGGCLNMIHSYYCDCNGDYSGRNCERECTVTMDVAFVLDLSGSVDEVYHVITNFTQYVMTGLPFQFQRVKVGVITFSDNAKMHFDLGEYADKREFLNALAFNEAGGKTNTADALRILRRNMFGGSEDRAGVPNRAVVLTDGHSNVNPEDTLDEAQRAKDDGMELYVVAVGDSPDMNEVNDIATSGTDHVFKVVDTDDIVDQSAALLDKLCV